MMILRNTAFGICILFSFSLMAQVPPIQIKDPNAVNKKSDITPFGLWVTPSYGQDFGRFGGLDKIIDQYNASNAEVLQTDLPYISSGINMNITGDLMINHFYFSIGYGLNAYMENSVYDDRASQRFKHRYHVHLKRSTLSLQSGYVLHPRRYINLMFGGKLETGNLQFMTGTFEPTEYASFTREEYRKRDKYKANYGGAFGRFMFGIPKFSGFQIVVEGQYMLLLNDVDLMPLDQEINGSNAQAAETYSLEHSFYGFKVGVAMGFVED